MSTRLKIGLRKAPSATRERGRQRRKLLLKAAYDLLCVRPIEDISFRASESADGHVCIDAAYVDEHLAELARDQDLSRYIL